MLSRASRWLTYLNAVLYAALGGILFVFPGKMAPVFAWKVSVFVTMTIGGWCLGNAWLAWISARRWVASGLLGDDLSMALRAPRSGRRNRL